VYREWNGKLPGIEVVPAGRPGPVSDMTQLVNELERAILPFLIRPFAFFGHSMGAGVAFELARALRRSGSPLPRILILSGARAPHLRGDVEPPDDSGPIPDALRSDVRLFSLHRYASEPPLACPIVAYGGASDPNVRPEHLEGWRDYTTASFRRREFPGGHFYLQTSVDRVLAALAEDL
jgi:medium-chain acyl-[acyl-carrier-protein] hydrolase